MDGSKPKVLLLAAGKGKRLGELTLNTPKPLLKISDAGCCLDYWLSLFSRNSNWPVYVNTHYLAEAIKNYVNVAWPQYPKILNEPVLLGGLGTLHHFIKSNQTPGGMLVVFADTIFLNARQTLVFDAFVEGIVLATDYGAVFASKINEFGSYGYIRNFPDGTKTFVQKPEFTNYIPEFDTQIFSGCIYFSDVLLNQLRICPDVNFSDSLVEDIIYPHFDSYSVCELPGIPSDIGTLNSLMKISSQNFNWNNHDEKIN